MDIRQVAVTNMSGLHARASGKVVQTARNFSCEISLVAKGRRADARNILAVMLLSASVGTMVRVEASGPEETRAAQEIAALFQNGFGESVA